MKKRKRSRPNEMKLNVQLENAISWLRAQKVIKNYNDVATQMNVSKASISAYITKSRPVSGGFAYNFEKMYLRNEKLTLNDFELPILVKQAQQLNQDDIREVLDLLSTKILWLEGGVQIILEKLDAIDNKLVNVKRELQKRTKKIVQ